MGLNNSPRTFRPDLWITVDDPSHFLQSIWMDPKIMKFVRSEHRQATLFESEARMPSSTTAEECPNVIFYDSDLEFETTTFLSRDSVSWGGQDANRRGRSVMLAAFKILYHMGAGHVFLLGVDFRMTEDYAYHFPQNRSKASIEGNLKTYKILSERFKKLQPLFKNKDFHVWNCNSDSELKAFPYLPFEAALKFATAQMPFQIDAEPSDGLYDRIQGRNASAQIFAPDPSEKNISTFRRIDRYKRPKTLKAETLPLPPSLPSNNCGVLLFADRELEWLIPWWIHHFEKSNPKLPVAIADFGLSDDSIQWLIDKNVQVIPKPNNLPKLRSTWFYKPFALNASPFNLTVFSDLDCEIRGDISPMFSWIDHGLVLGNDLYPLGSSRKLFRERFYYNSGLIGVNQGNPTLSQWSKEVVNLHEMLRSDQEILNLVIYESEATIVELPPHFHQLRLDGDNSEAVVMHWTGDPGKTHIRKDIDRLNIDPIK